MKTKKAFIIISIFLSLISVKLPCLAQVYEDTLNVLFVGNSYTERENLPQIVSIISDGSETKLITRKSVGWANLREHWHGAKGLKTIEIIRNGKFDIVVLQESSMGSINERDSLYKYVKLFCDFIKDCGAKPYLYLTWAREKVPQYQKIINEVYMEVATENDATIVPVGKAWALARQLRPDIELYDSDGSHPSKLGTFLTACVFVATILEQMPPNLKNEYYTLDSEMEDVVLMILDPLDVVFCQKIAEEIIISK